jgi:hypothetical protein
VGQMQCDAFDLDLHVVSIVTAGKRAANLW